MDTTILAKQKTNAKKAKSIDATAKTVFLLSAIFSVVAVLAIFIFLFMKGLPAINKIGLKEFIFGREWKPDSGDAYGASPQGSYGIFNMIVGSFAATAGALLIGGTTGFFTAVFISKFCPKKIKVFLSQIINLLAGIPSVVYGFFGITVLLPLLGVYSDNGSGSGITAVAIILGVMILPTVVSLSVTSLDAVPRSNTEGALALGASYNRSVFTVTVPAAKSGIAASLILGIGRAMGETMAVVMVAGNSAVIPKDFFSSFRTMTANIVLEQAYAGELQMGALIATGCVLFTFILIINIIFNAVKQRGELGRKKTKNMAQKLELPQNNDNLSIDAATSVDVFLNQSQDAATKTAPPALSAKDKNLAPYKEHKTQVHMIRLLPTVGKYLSYAAALIATLSLISIVIFVFVKGFPHITKQLLCAKYQYGGEKTVRPSIKATLMLLAFSVPISVIIGVFSAIFLNEYAKKNPLVKLIHLAVETLSGIPSIVYGLFGMLFFTQYLNLGVSVISGALTVTIMSLPLIIRSVEESLKSIPLA